MGVSETPVSLVSEYIGDMRQASVLAIEIQSVSVDVVIVDSEAAVVYGYGFASPRRLVKQRANCHRGRSSVLHQSEQPAHRPPGINNVLHDQNVSAREVRPQGGPYIHDFGRFAATVR